MNQGFCGGSLTSQPICYQLMLSPNFNKLFDPTTLLWHIQSGQTTTLYTKIEFMSAGWWDARLWDLAVSNLHEILSKFFTGPILLELLMIFSYNKK